MKFLKYIFFALMMGILLINFKTEAQENSPKKEVDTEALIQKAQERTEAHERQQRNEAVRKDMRKAGLPEHGNWEYTWKREWVTDENGNRIAAYWTKDGGKTYSSDDPKDKTVYVKDANGKFQKATKLPKWVRQDENGNEIKSEEKKTEEAEAEEEKEGEEEEEKEEEESSTEGEGQGEGEGEGEGEEESNNGALRYQSTQYRMYGKTKYPESEPNPGLMGYVSPGQSSTTPTVRTPKKTWNDPLPRHISKETMTDPSYWSASTLSTVLAPLNNDFDAPDSKYVIKKSPRERVSLTSEEDGSKYYADKDAVIVRKDGTFTVKPKSLPVSATKSGADPKSPLAVDSGNKIFDEAFDKLYLTFTNSRAVVYGLAAFGLLGFAVATIFGKLSWLWLTIITVSLFVLASAEALISYTVRAGEGSVQSMSASWVKERFKSNDMGRLDLRDDSADFDYEKMLKNSVKVKDSSHLKTN